MAAVDSLIRLIAAQNADSLLLASDEVPRLSRAGAVRPLSMPPVGAPMMELFVAEVLSPAQIEEARGAGALTVDYGEFVVTVKRQGAGWSLSFKKRPPRKAGPASTGPASTEPPAAGLEMPGTPPATAPARPAAAPVAAAPMRGAGPPRDVEAGTGSELLDRWLRRAAGDRASDLIVSSGHAARLRTPAGLIEMPGPGLSAEEILALLDPWLIDAQRAALSRHGAADFALVWRDPAGDDAERGARFRVNLFHQGGGLAAVFRPVRRDPPALSDLNLPESLARLARFPNGLVLVTGPSGAGKSTTMVALIEQLGGELARHIITLEDPIEYEYRPRLALVHQRELGVHVDSFEAGLRSALRESPDVILVGEMRDRPTIAAALTAAETGHLVLSSLHAGSAAMAVERVIDAFPEHQQRQVRGQLAGTLRAVLTQHLLPARSAGRSVPAIELLIVTPATAALIRDGKAHQLATAIQTGRDDGMIPLDRSLADLVEAGTVDYDTAAAVTLDGGLQLRELLGGSGGPAGARGRGRALR